MDKALIVVGQFKTMKHIYAILYLIIVSLLPAVRVDAGNARTDKIIISGTGDSYRVFDMLARAFDISHPQSVVQVPTAVGSTRGIREVAEGACDLARVTRPPTGPEIAWNLKYRVIGYCPIVFIANNSVTGIESLSTEQIIGIYSGRITHWNQIGGPPRKIYVVNRQIGDTSRRIVENRLSGFKAVTSVVGYTAFNVDEKIQILNRYRFTIAYVPLASLPDTHLIRFRLNGVAPSIENVKAGRYSLFIPFALAWKEPVSDTAQSFLTFVFSREGRRILLKNSTLPADEWKKQQAAGEHRGPPLRPAPHTPRFSLSPEP